MLLISVLRLNLKLTRLYHKIILRFMKIRYLLHQSSLLHKKLIKLQLFHVVHLYLKESYATFLYPFSLNLIHNESTSVSFSVHLNPSHNFFIYIFVDRFKIV